MNHKTELDECNFGYLNLSELAALYKYAMEINHKNLPALCTYIVNIIINMNPEEIKEYF